PAFPRVRIAGRVLSCGFTTMIYLLIFWPLVMAAVTLATPSNRWRPWLLPVGAVGHLGLFLAILWLRVDRAALTGWGGWLLLDALGKVILGLVSVLFFLCALYAPGYLAL